MAPKKKGNKKGNDDWEAELGETPDPTAAAASEAKDVEAPQEPPEDVNEAGGGGLMAALKKNRSKKQKKGKHVEDDFLEGEDPPAANGVNGQTEADGIQDLAMKAPEEANADDLFDAQITKAKGGKGKQSRPEPEPSTEEPDGDEGGSLKSKKEKEKEKKEREKQRKKEQVCRTP